MLGQSGQGLLAGVALVWRPGQDLELGDGARALAVDRAQAVGAGVAAADDDDVLAFGRDEVAIRDAVALAAPVLEREVVHGEVDPPKLAPGDLEVPRPLRSSGQDDGVEVLAERLDGQCLAHVHARREGDPRRFHQREAAVENALLHLELGDAVAEEPADTVGLLEHRHRVPGAVELLGGGEARPGPTPPRRPSCPCAPRAGRERPSPRRRRGR